VFTANIMGHSVATPSVHLLILNYRQTLFAVPFVDFELQEVS